MSSDIDRDKLESYLDIPIEQLNEQKPSDARDALDYMALSLQEKFEEEVFARLLSYLHKYMTGLSYHHFIIPGCEGKDIYQECTIALRFKAISKFDPTRGMSFLNFAKMCIYRHVVTILNTSKNRKKDQPMNMAIPIDQSLGQSDDEAGDGGTLSNVIPDSNSNFVESMCHHEDMEKTKESLLNVLSPFEKEVLMHYLNKMPYKAIARVISDSGRECDEKSVDNALLRIRNKAAELKRRTILPMFSDCPEEDDTDEIDDIKGGLD